MRRRTAAGVRRARRQSEPSGPGPSLPRFDFRPSAPDVSGFPRVAVVALVSAMRSQAMTNADLGYGDPRGVEALRSALAEYLGRVRGVVAEPEQRRRHERAIRRARDSSAGRSRPRGAKRIAFENPSHPEQRRIAARAGLADRAGRRRRGGHPASTSSSGPDVDAVVLTPAHQHPTGAVLAGDRRAACSPGCGRATRSRSRTTTTPSTATTAPPSAPSTGWSLTGSCTPARRARRSRRRCGSVGSSSRRGLLEAVTDEKDLADCGTARIDQYAFADFLARGELDRHLRRMRTRYRRRRGLLIDGPCATRSPRHTVRGIAAGLHADGPAPRRLRRGGDPRPGAQAGDRRSPLCVTSGSNPAPDRRRSCSATHRFRSPRSPTVSASWPRLSEQGLEATHGENAVAEVHSPFTCDLQVFHSPGARTAKYGGG